MKTFSDAQLLIDTRAVEIAAGVQERQILHEEECRDRYIEQRQTMSALGKNLDGIRTLLMSGLAAVVVLLITGMSIVLWDKLTERDQKWEHQTPYTQQGPLPESPPPSALSSPRH